MDGRKEGNGGIGMRKILALVSLSILLLLMTYSYIEHDEKDPYMAYIMKNFEKFKGREVDFAGRVVTFNGSMAKLKIMEPPYCTVNVTGKILNANIHRGDVIEVLGIMQETYKIKAEKIHVIKSFEYSFIFIRSLPAIPFVAYLFLKKWRFDFKKFRFEERECRTGQRM